MKAALLFVLLLVVPLDAPFVSGEATALRVDGDMMWVEARVVTQRTASVVLVRAVGPDDQPLEPFAMDAQGDEWTARIFLPRRSDLRLTFEHIDPEGFSFVSRPVPLIELGVDAALFSLDEGFTTDATADTDQEPSNDRARWGWLAIGLAAAAIALTLIAFALGWFDRSDDDAVE